MNQLLLLDSGLLIIRLKNTIFVKLWAVQFSNPSMGNTHTHISTLGALFPPDSLYAASVLVIELLLQDGAFALLGFLPPE